MTQYLSMRRALCQRCVQKLYQSNGDYYYYHPLCYHTAREPTATDSWEGATRRTCLILGGWVRVLCPPCRSGSCGEEAATRWLSQDGEVWSCGQNHRGQLGLGHTSDVSTLHPGPALKQRVVNVSCGWDFTLFLTDCGQVLTCGSNAFGQLGVAKTSTHSAEPVRVESLGEPVVSVAAGLRHALAVTDSGCVYQWGLGLLTHARRAVGPNSVPLHFNSQVPVRVPGFDHVTARTVAAGSAHCVCLTGGGDVFLWGSNKYGQLTTNDCFSTYPALLNRSLLDGEAATHVWSGWTHLVAKTESGKVFTWGRGNYGQLGRTEPTNHSAVLQSDDSPVVEDVKEVSFPGKVDALYGAEQIACGSEHNLAVVGDAPLRACAASFHSAELRVQSEENLCEPCVRSLPPNILLASC
uniref:Secretion regulating guanine nucleotide exchange factor n=1 Tax=Gadus morhua TaxID=8049 RepID=A0A8C5FTL3_GADMO